MEECGAECLHICTGADRVFAQVPAELACTGPPVEQPEHVPGHGVERNALAQPALHIGDVRINRALQIPRCITEETRIYIRQQRRCLIGRTTHHHPVHICQMAFGIIQRSDAAVDNNRKVRILALHLIYEPVVKRRHLAVFSWREPRQPRLARVNDKSVNPSSSTRSDERAQAFRRILVVHADAAFDGDRRPYSSAHDRDAFGNQLRLAHEAGAEFSGLHAIRGSTDVEIDLVIAESFRDPRRSGEAPRFGAPKLQRDGMLKRVEADQPCAVTADDGLRRDHLRIQACAPREQAVKIPAVPVRPLHHRRNAKTVTQTVHAAVFDRGGGKINPSNGKRCPNKDQCAISRVLVSEIPNPGGRRIMPTKETIRKAKEDKREGKASSTQAGEFIREEMHKVRRGEHGVRSPQQAIAIGLSEARRAGVDLPPPARGKAKVRTRRSESYAYEVGQGRRKTRKQPRVARAVKKTLKREPTSTVSHKALSRHAKSAAKRQSAASRSAAARKGARTKGPAGRVAAARKAARTRKRSKR